MRSITNISINYQAARFAFSAKECDTESGLSYFGSRYYSSDLSIWLAVDPMSDKYPSLSPYVYCANNPVKLVDPNGEDVWELDDKGNLTYIRKDAANDIVYAKNRTVFKTFAAGSINQNRGKYDFQADIDNNNKMEDYSTKYMTFSNSETAFSFFEFAAENTNVEWAISISNNESRVGTAGEAFIEMSSVPEEAEYYHNHLVKDTYNKDVSKETLSESDFDQAKVNNNNGIKTGVYMPGIKCYFILETKRFPNGSFTDFFGNIEPSKSYQ